MTSRRLPTLASLQALIAAAKLRSFNAAADHLAISVPALSRRIQQLEAIVGVRLLERMACGVTLTSQGASYLAEVEPAVRLIRSATRSVRHASADRPLRLGVSHSFATQWMLPRLARASEAAGVRIELHRTRDPQALLRGDLDLAVWGGDIDVDTPSECLFDADAVAVATPDTRGNAIFLDKVEEIEGHRLLNVESPGNVWERWLDALGCRNSSMRTAHFDTLHHVYEAANAGLGVALAIPLVFEPYLTNVRMKPCLPVRAPLGMGYRIYLPDPAICGWAVVSKFREWLHQEVGQSCRLFDQWWTAQLSGTATR